MRPLPSLLLPLLLACTSSEPESRTKEHDVPRPPRTPAPPTGLRLPVSTSDVPLDLPAHTLFHVTLQGDEIRYGWRNWPNPAPELVAERLRETLTPKIERLHAGDHFGQLVVHAEADVPFSKVLPVLVASHLARMDHVGFAVTGKTGKRLMIAMSVPEEWGHWEDPNGLPPRDKPVPTVVMVDHEGYWIAPAGLDPLQLDADPAKLQAWAEKFTTDERAKQGDALDTTTPEPNRVLLRVEPNVTVGHIVATLDALRGPNCEFLPAYSGYDVPLTCWLWAVQIGASPAITGEVKRAAKG